MTNLGKTISELQERNREKLAIKLTHREDGKKPQLHAGSMWNVLLITEVDQITTDSFTAGALAVIGEIEKFRDESKIALNTVEGKQHFILSEKLKFHLTTLEQSLQDNK